MGYDMKEAILNNLQELLKEGEAVLKTKYVTSMGITCVNHGNFTAWRSKVLTLIDGYNLKCEPIKQCILDCQYAYPSNVTSIQQYINAIKDSINSGSISIVQKKEFANVALLETIFDRFHKVARQLRSRYSGRLTLEINDEYDVQDLLHALLVLAFDDVRREEWTPSYAGGAVRADFLLKDCQTVIEVKKTRPSMTAKTLGDELIIDREKYKAHPDCKQLYCFVYDPEGRLGNPVGIKRDLEKDNEGYIKVFIKPE